MDANRSKDGAGDPSATKSQKSPILQMLIQADTSLTRSLSLSSSNSAPLGHLRKHMKALEVSCHGVAWLGICMVFLWFVKNPDALAFGFNLFIALILDIIFVAVMKAAIRRPRPTDNQQDMFLTMSVDALSCPSGHASRAVLLSLLVLYKSSLHIILCLPVVLWSICVCASRVMLGRHYVGDVVIGCALGLVEYWLTDMIWMGPELARYYLQFFFDIENFHKDYDDSL